MPEEPARPPSRPDDCSANGRSPDAHSETRSPDAHAEGRSANGRSPDGHRTEDVPSAAVFAAPRATPAQQAERTPGDAPPGTGSDGAGGDAAPGPRDALTDVAGLRVGHAQWRDEGRLTGTTVVLAPEGGAVAAVDVRGGGPGTRETDALDPCNLVPTVDAVVLTGGSAFGLDAAAGVAVWLEEQGRGVRVGADPAQVVPVVPAAALFDLGRGGNWQARPDAALGRAAVEAAHLLPAGHPVAQGDVGAGTGAVAGGMKGGVGTASVVLASGTVVAALVAVNASGSAVDPATGRLYAFPTDGPAAPSRNVHESAVRRLAAARAETERRSGAAAAPPLNTTLVVVATDAALDRAQARKCAGVAHDGLARALRPVHLLTDGDTVFALATGARPLPTPVPPGAVSSDGGAGDEVVGRAGRARALQASAAALNEILAAGADVVSRAVGKAMLAARTVDGPGGLFPSYTDLYRTDAATPRSTPST